MVSDGLRLSAFSILTDSCWTVYICNSFLRIGEEFDGVCQNPGNGTCQTTSFSDDTCQNCPNSFLPCFHEHSTRHRRTASHRHFIASRSRHGLHACKYKHPI
ncbi:hypothetical protein BKA65DRAFT_495379 [Rhexocercosporidium sp. MPI-PUGE-AT-0058]|nr:hypothetical protein BKA65DRAFT_495379 [Rhexocercosporidium sp. MPI-PUGE-AT-0058]